jgi:hypothetical protein
VDPRTDLDDKEKLLSLPGLFNCYPKLVQPVASRYTDYAVPAHLLLSNTVLFCGRNSEVQILSTLKFLDVTRKIYTIAVLVMVYI